MDDEPQDRRRFEPWPWVLALMLASMIGISLGFFTIAVTHPDPVVGDARQ